MNRSARQSVTDLLYLAPQLTLYLGLLVVPFLVALPIIFTNKLDFLDTDAVFIGFSNFVSLFNGPISEIFLPVLLRTAGFVVVSYVASVVTGFSLALVLFELTSRLKGAFFTIIYLPWMISGVGLGLMMIMLFSRDTGTVNLAIETVGGPANVFDVRSDFAVLVGLPVLHAWKTAGFNMALFLGGLLTIPRETIESSRMDGARYVSRVLHIYIPQIVPSFVVVSIFALINGFGIFDELVGLGGLAGNTSARFMAVMIYELGFASSQNFGAKIGTLAEGLTVSLVVFGPLVVVAFFLNKLQKKLQYN